ncbi:MAG: hypothetical protein IJ229_14800 [Clostridia bacterium]|nr:hypothetical protein [Clostridia bacterium]
MEADFQREYGMDLTREIGQLSCRRFLILLRGLSPGGAVARKLEQLGREGDDGETGAAAFFSAMTACT